MVQLQAKQHLLIFGLILAKRIGSILISGNIMILDHHDTVTPAS
jgi:hypothetical protein